MTGKIKRRRKPIPRRNIKLTTLFPQLRNREDGSLECFGIKRNPITNPSEIRQIKHHRPENGDIPRRSSPECEEIANDVVTALPEENGGKCSDPEKREEGLVRCQKRW